MIKLRKTPKFGVCFKLMRTYNYVTINLLIVDVSIGRPIVPRINKLIDWYICTRFHKVVMYVKASKEQIDADLYYQTNYDEDASIYSGEFTYSKEEARWDWGRQITIKENAHYIPLWLRHRIDRYLENYYERQYLKQLRKEEDHEEVNE